MRNNAIQLSAKIAAMAVALVGLPLLGPYMAGRPLTPYLNFPPVTRYIEHWSFSWWAFIALATFVCAVIGLIAIKGWQNCRSRNGEPRKGTKRPFPWWGWAGLAGMSCAWIIAWSRFEWIKPVQAHTFTPLWIGYIVIVNAISQQRTGGCLMLARPSFFLLLFPLSALFWWFFEYLNRFVQNWYYIGPKLNAWSYFWYATLPFSTVLPAVLSTCYWVKRWTWIQTGFHPFPSLPPLKARWPAIVTMLAAGAGLIFLGIWPNILFPLLWLSPLLLVVSLQALIGERHLLSEMTTGDWRRAVSAAVAALICGFFWEMWNVNSLAKWKYSIPLVHRFQVFEMPILGYAGYLPFGLECVVIGDLLKEAIKTVDSDAV